jgi:hypothetical protein
LTAQIEEERAFHMAAHRRGRPETARPVEGAGTRNPCRKSTAACAWLAAVKMRNCRSSEPAASWRCTTHDLLEAREGKFEIGAGNAAPDDHQLITNRPAPPGTGRHRKQKSAECRTDSHARTRAVPWWKTVDRLPPSAPERKRAREIGPFGSSKRNYPPFTHQICEPRSA